VSRNPLDKINSVVGPVLEPDAILTRTNAAAVHAVLTTQTDGKSVHLVGGGDDIVSLPPSRTPRTTSST
jgi:hypothetical protein